MAKNFTLFELLRQEFGRYAFKEDLADPAAIIRGVAARTSLTSQPVWLLERQAYAAGIWTVEYADDAKFTQVWDDRLASFGPSPGGGGPGSTINIPGSASAVAVGVRTSLGSYTVPADETFSLQFWEGSGNNIALYETEIEGVVIDKKWAYYSGPLFLDAQFGGLFMVEGETVEIFVTNLSDEVGDFIARIVGV